MEDVQDCADTECCLCPRVLVTRQPPPWNVGSLTTEAVSFTSRWPQVSHGARQSSCASTTVPAAGPWGPLCHVELSPSEWAGPQTPLLQPLVSHTRIQRPRELETQPPLLPLRGTPW